MGLKYKEIKLEQNRGRKTEKKGRGKKRKDREKKGFQMLCQNQSERMCVRETERERKRDKRVKMLKCQNNK
jgi:hypothetical protein